MAQSRRSFFPFGAAFPKFVTEVEQLRHVFGIERFRAGIWEVSWDVRDVVVNVILLRELVHLIEIANTLRFDQRGNRPPGNG